MIENPKFSAIAQSCSEFIEGNTSVVNWLCQTAQHVAGVFSIYKIAKIVLYLHLVLYLKPVVDIFVHIILLCGVVFQKDNISSLSVNF